MGKKVLVFLSLVISPSLLLGQIREIDGYRGIWFGGPQPVKGQPVFSGGGGTFSARHRPMAIYSPEAEKTFFVYGGTKHADTSHLLIMISFYDHRSNKVPRPVVVYDKMGVREPFDNPTLSIDREGYLWVFISGRGRTRPGFIFKSISPYSISGFEEIRQWEMVSPQPWYASGKGFMLLYARAINGLRLYFSSSRDGKSWEDARLISSMGGNFQISGMHGDKLVTVLNYFNPLEPEGRSNLYLLQTNDEGKSWKTIDGDVIELPLRDPHNIALIKDYRSDNRLVYLSDLNFDLNGDPVILYILSESAVPGAGTGTRELMVAYRKEGKWKFSHVCEVDHNYDVGSLFIGNDSWRVVAPSDPGPHKAATGGQMVVWESKDEGTIWEKAGILTNSGKHNNSFIKRVAGSSREFAAFWVDGDIGKLSESRIYFTNSTFDKVWMLPYEMKRNYARPVRVR